MSKKLNTLAIIIIVLLFLANLVLAVLLFTNHAAAATTVSQCPGDKCPPEGKIRVQVAIPGLSTTCTYTDTGNIVMGSNGSPQVAVRACNYVDSLPVFVAKFYKFSIGLIAILAVIMIMFGGLQWIFASGNMGKVSDAKSTITAAIAGLILALTSYVILYNINPKLVNLELPGVSPIKKLEQYGSIWCDGMPAYYNNDQTKPMVFYPLGQWGVAGAGQGNKASNYTTRCGKTYEFGYEEGGVGGKLVQLGTGTCSGSYCPSNNEICLSQSGISYCGDPKELCENWKNVDSCNSINSMIDTTNKNKNFLNMSCAKRDDRYSLFKGFVGSGDQCVWGQAMYCPPQTKQVDCLTGPAQNGDMGCWKTDEDKGKTPVTKDAYQGSQSVKLTCTSGTGIAEANLICCYNSTDNIFKAYGQVTAIFGYVPGKAYIPDCKNDIKKCSDYESADAMEADPCKVCSGSASRGF